MQTTILGLRIYLPQPATYPGSIPAIGLYGGAYPGPMQLRWSEEPLIVPTSPALTPSAWASGVIADGGFGAIDLRAELRMGGSTGDYSGLDVQTNAAASILDRLAAYGLDIAGRRCEVWEFRGTDTDSGSISAGPIFCGVIAIPTRTEVGCKIPIKDPQYLLTAATATAINNGGYTSVADIEQAVADGSLTANYPYADQEQNGKAVPVTMGSLAYDGVDGAPAKLIRTASAVVPLVINGSAGNLATVLSLPGDATQYRYAYSGATDYGDIVDLPVYGIGDQTIYGSNNSNLIVDYYIKIGDGGHWERSTDGGQSWAPYSTAGSMPLSLFNRISREANGLAPLYLSSVAGKSSGSGRLIAWATFDPSGAMGTAIHGGGGVPDAGVIRVQIADNNYFTKDDGTPEHLGDNHNYATPTDDDTWVQIQAKYQNFAADVWPGAGWL